MEVTAVLQTVLKKKTLNVGMHSDIYEQIWFKLGMMIATTEFCIFSTGVSGLTLIQGHRVVRKQKLLHQFSHISADLDGIWHTV